eukprot:m.14840 g.14840  ORF g.14840 m.14840 type:complete len:320 (+) comp10310_c0_seq1:256-1215(+)
MAAWIPPSQRVGVEMEETHAEKIAAMFGGAKPVTSLSRKTTLEIEKEFPGFTAVVPTLIVDVPVEEKVVVGTPAGGTQQSVSSEFELLGLAARKKAFPASVPSDEKPVIRRRSLVDVSNEHKANKPVVSEVPAGVSLDPKVPTAVNSAILAAREAKKKMLIDQERETVETEDAKLTIKERALYNLSHQRSTSVSVSGSSLRNLRSEPIESPAPRGSSMRERAHTSVTPAKPKAPENGCAVCKHSVFEMEKLIADGKLYHKWCFRCGECNKQVSTSTYAALNEKMFCKPCFKKLFKLKGNYDGGFGTEQHKMKWDKKSTV